MFKRQKVGSVLCPSCGKLVGVRDESCWNCGRRNPGLWGFAQVVRNFRGALDFDKTVIWGCAALYVATLLVDLGSVRLVEGGMSFLAPGFPALLRFGASGAIPVFGYGRWWTVLSAGWLHANLLHIVFNMLWVRQLAPATAELFGTARAIIIYTLASISGFLLSSVAAFFPIPILRGAAFTLGASAPIFGLLGALVAYGRRTGSSQVGGQAMTYAVVMFLFGFIMPGIDNFAHLGGFLGGYAVATVLNPLEPEKSGHFLGAVLCFALTALAILASLLQGILF